MNTPILKSGLVITWVAIDAITPYENNPRKIPKEAIEKVAASIREFGFRQPIVVDKDMVVVVGHTRLLAARSLGYDEVPVLVASDLPPEKVKAYRLADNKTNEFTSWDDDRLMEELTAFLSVDGFDMEDFGFDMSFLDKSADDVEEDDFEPDSAYTEAKNNCHVTQGDIWKLGNHRLMCGDSTSADDVGRLMGGERADLCITDPPYGINIVNDKGKVGAGNLAKNRKYPKVIADDSTDTAEKAYQILKDKSKKMIIWGGNYFTRFLDFSDGWIIWDKRGDMPSNNFADGEMAWCSFHTPVRIYRQIWNGMIREGKEERERVHPTQKPVHMISSIIEDFSNQDDLVADVFGGSGTTLIACEEMERQCRMMEFDPIYCQVIINRWEALTGKSAEKVC